MNEQAIETRFQAQVRAKQIEMLFRQLPMSLTTSVLAATLLAGFLWRLTADPILPVWWACVVVVEFGFQFGLVSAYRRRSADSRVAWHVLAVVAVSLSGIVWGMAGWLFFSPTNAIALTFVTIVLAGMATGVIAAQASFPPGQWAYATPTMVPIAVRYLAEGGDMTMLGVMCLIHLAAVLVFAHQVSRMLIESIGLHLEKHELAEKLHEERSAAEEARAEAEDANLAKSKFLAAASHDLRQPIHAQGLFLEALARSELSPSQRSMLDNARATSAASSEMLNTLLDFSRIEAGVMEPNARPFHLQPMFNKIENEMAPQAVAKGLVFRVRETPAAVESDPALVELILRNLVSNAIRYTEHGGILIACRKRGARVAVEVWDTGVGIPAAQIDEVFREFHQLGNPERDRRKGLGLGLAIADRLAKAMGLELSVASVPHRGSVFRLSLPLTHAAVTSEESDTKPYETRMLKARVLVIDDDEAVRAGMLHLLQEWGCECEAVESIDEALASARERLPDIVVSDYRLREQHTGIEAIEKLRAEFGPDLPALLITGDTIPERLREARRRNIPLLHKPVSSLQLNKTLSLLLSGEGY